MSLETMLDQFRFAPYRVTSYETFVALLTQWTELNVLTVYYLLVPGISAALSVLVAIAFARIFCPCVGRWAPHCCSFSSCWPGVKSTWPMATVSMYGCSKAKAF